MSQERIILATSDDEIEDDLYKGYNEFHPVLDTRNLQEDEEFRATVNKSRIGVSQGRQLRTGGATAGLAFTKSAGLRSRRTAAAVASGRTGTGIRTGAATGRPATAVRGAGYTSQSSQNRIFDPLGLATAKPGQGTSGAFHLQDQTTPEWKIKQLEQQICKLLDESIAAVVHRQDYVQALDLAKDCVAKERSLNRLKEQSGLMETHGVNADLTFATMFNLAERYGDAQMWPESINTYQAILKNRSFTNTGRLRMNIGEIYFRQGQYPKAIKFFRMALDQIPNTQNGMRLKLMANIGLAFVRLNQYADAIAAFEFILAERGDWDDAETVFHLIVCYYALGDGDKMRYYFNKLLQVKVDDQFEERYGHHEVLTNGGTIFAGVVDSSDHPAISASAGAEQRNVSSPVLLIRDEHDHYNNLMIEAIRNDRLRQYEKEQIRFGEWAILTAAKLIAPFIGRSGVDQPPPPIPTSDAGVFLSVPEPTSVGAPAAGFGYDWCLEQIRRMATVTGGATFVGYGSGLNYAQLADELELYKAVRHLRQREFDQAIATLKIFERKSLSSAASGHASATPIRLSSASARVTSTAATNLSFLYLLQHDFESAARYADEAIATDRYCLGAILNKGSLCYYQGDYRRAIDHYHEVIANNSTIFEAYFNLALAERKLGRYDEALDALYRLRTIVKMPRSQNRLNQKITNTIEVNLMYQIGLIYESMGNQDQARDFYQKVLQMVPTDVSLLIKMADMAADDNDRKQSLHYLLEAYRYLPSHIPTIERLAAYYIEMKMYDQTIKYLEQLAMIQPQQIKWQLMIAASYRRAGNYPQALATYQAIHQRFPNNIDCLKFLVRLCTELENETATGNGAGNFGHLAERYADELRRLEKTKELREEQKLTSSRSASRASTSHGSRARETVSPSRREGSAATTTSSSNGSGSSSQRYLSSATSGFKSATPKLDDDASSVENGVKPPPPISAMVDQVVRQLDSAMEPRPTTSWRNTRNLKSSHGGRPGTSAGQPDEMDFAADDDFNIDELLPD